MIGFDIDCSCVCYDGKCRSHHISPVANPLLPGRRVWATPRSMTAIITRANTIDMTRRSPSYETRLVKYAQRGWEIWHPDLRRGALDESVRLSL